jgi:uncharacterized protein YjiS (DUF1127 family)
MSIAFIMNLFKNLRQWHRRRIAVRHLSELDDHLLRDIGMERADIQNHVNGSPSVKIRENAYHRQGSHRDVKPVVPRAVIGGLLIH